jgi:hypothetical protein
MPDHQPPQTNLNGRPKGVPNKVTADLRAKVHELLAGQYETIIADFEGLEPKDRIKLFIDLLPFALPKLQATSLEIDFENFSEDQLDEIINKLIEKSNGDAS